MLGERSKFQGYGRYAPEKMKFSSIKELGQLRNASNRKNFSAMKYSQRIKQIDLSNSSSKSPKISKSTMSERKTFLKNAILKPITTRAAEYEHAIKTFLGISLKSSEKPKIKSKRISPQYVARSPVELRKNNTLNGLDEKLKEIEEKELDLKKNLRNLNLKQKVFEENRSFVIGESRFGEGKFIVNNDNKHPRDGQPRIYKSLQGVKKILPNH